MLINKLFKPLSSITDLYLNKQKFSTIIAEKRQDKRYMYKFNYGVGWKPHPNKIVTGGDDAHFVTDNLIVVADGVGTWTIGDVQSTDYPKKIIRMIQKIYTHQKKQSIQNPIYLVKQAVNLVRVMGATTLTVLTLHPQNGSLRSYYIGDSVYGFFKEKQVQMTYAQMIAFNKPLQIDNIYKKIQGGYQNMYQYPQIKDDLIVVATDGLWDNLGLQRIHWEIRGPASKFKNGIQKSLQQIVDSLVEINYNYSLRSEYSSPFHQRALQQGKKFPKQGKIDDITIVLAKIVKEELHKNQSYF